jgi:hypothetical protein
LFQNIPEKGVQLNLIGKNGLSAVETEELVEFAVHRQVSLQVPAFVVPTVGAAGWDTDSASSEGTHQRDHHFSGSRQERWRQEDPVCTQKDLFDCKLKTLDYSDGQDIA